MENGSPARGSTAGRGGWSFVVQAGATWFPTVANFQAIAGNQVVMAIVALAALIPLITNQFDPTVSTTTEVAPNAMDGGMAFEHSIAWDVPTFIEAPYNPLGTLSTPTSRSCGSRTKVSCRSTTPRSSALRHQPNLQPRGFT
jgi:hypothetical protein